MNPQALFPHEKVCPTCAGVKVDCVVCDGTGVVVNERRKTDSVAVTINKLQTDLQIAQVERDEAVALLRDVTAIALPYVPKSIRDRRTFTVNLARAFLSNFDFRAKSGRS